MAKLGMVGTGRKIVAQEGLKGLATGFGSTAVGYFGQGGLKFALNDFFKLEFAKRAGGAEQAVEHRMAIYLGAAASVSSTIFLRLQTLTRRISNLLQSGRVLRRQCVVFSSFRFCFEVHLLGY